MRRFLAVSIILVMVLLLPANAYRETDFPREPQTANPGSILISPPETSWNGTEHRDALPKLPQDPVSVPLSIGNRLYVATEEGIIYALSTGNQSTHSFREMLQWSYDFNQRIIAPLTFQNGLLFVLTEGGHLYALRTRESSFLYDSGHAGTPVWTLSHGLQEARLELYHPTGENRGPDTLMILTGDQEIQSRNISEIRAYRLSDRSLAWTYRPDGRVQSPVTLHRNELIVPQGNGVITSLNARSGERIGRVQLSSVTEEKWEKPVITPLPSENKFVLIPGGQNTEVLLLDESVFREQTTRVEDRYPLPVSNINYMSPPRIVEGKDGVQVGFSVLEDRGRLMNGSHILHFGMLEVSQGEIKRKWIQSREYRIPEEDEEDRTERDRIVSVPRPLLASRSREQFQFTEHGERVLTDRGKEEGYYYYLPGKKGFTVRSGSTGERLNAWTSDHLSEQERIREEDINMVPHIGIGGGSLYQISREGRIVRLKSEVSIPSPVSSLAPAGNTVTAREYPVLSWETSEDREEAERFELQINHTSSSPGEPVDRHVMVQGQSSFQIRENISTGSRVAWRIRRIGDSGLKSAWKRGQFWVGSRAGEPLPPDNFWAKARPSGALLQWDHSPSNDVSGYRVRYRISGTDSEGQTRQFGYISEGKIEGLENDEQYLISIMAIDSQGNRSEVLETTVRPRESIHVGSGTDSRAGTGTEWNNRSGTSLQDAIDRAAEREDPSDRIVLLSGQRFTLSEPVTLHGGVHLRGEGPGITILSGTTYEHILRVEGKGSSEDISISNLTLTGSSSAPGILATGPGHFTMKQCIIRDLDGVGLQVGEGMKVRARNNTFVGNAGSAIVSESYDGQFRNNIFVNNGRWAVEGTEEAESRQAVSYSLVSGQGAGAFNRYVREGKGIYRTPVEFVDLQGRDLRVRSGARSISAGHPEDPYANEPIPNGEQINLGAYGNTEWATPVRSIETADRDETNTAGCFLATAAFGSEMNVRINEYRLFRDRILSTTPAGREWVQTYYRISPPLAQKLTSSPLGKEIMRNLLSP